MDDKTDPTDNVSLSRVESREAAKPAATGRDFGPLLTPEQVALRLNVSPDWVRDHSCRKTPRLPVIRLSDGRPGTKGLLRYRASDIEKFIEEMARASKPGRVQ